MTKKEGSQRNLNINSKRQYKFKIRIIKKSGLKYSDFDYQKLKDSISDYFYGKSKIINNEYRKRSR